MENSPRKRGTIYAGTRIHSGIRKVHPKLNQTISTMFNAQHRKLVVTPSPLSPTFPLSSINLQCIDVDIT